MGADSVTTYFPIPIGFLPEGENLEKYAESYLKRHGFDIKLYDVYVRQAVYMIRRPVETVSTDASVL